MASARLGCAAAADRHRHVLLLALDLLLLVLDDLGLGRGFSPELLAEGLTEGVVGAGRTVGRVASALW